MHLWDTVWLWRFGALTTAIYAVAFVADFGAHLHEGWSEGVRQRDRILDARRDCEGRRFGSAVLQERCAQIRAAPLVVPWHVAFHHAGRHLATKMATALQSLAYLIAILVPTAALVFWCMIRSDQPRTPYVYFPPQTAATPHQHPMTTWWSSLTGGGGGGGHHPGATSVASAGQPKSCVVHLPPEESKKAT